MEIGLQVEPQFGFSWSDILSMARDAELAGFRAIWLSDHLFLNRDSVTTDCFEAWSTLAALAVSTTRIRIGTMVTCQSYRNPALLAKIAASVDQLSGGRLDFGIGAGWKEIEYRAYGYEFPPPSVRVDQLAETIEICTRIWTEERATFHGKHYRVDDAQCSPKPIQRPLPIWIGGRKPRVMRLGAKWANVFNYLPESGFPTPEQVREAMRELDVACRSVGRDPDTLRRSAFLFVVVASTQQELDAVVAEEATRARVTPSEWVAARTGAIVGLPGAVRSRLREYAAAGVQDTNVRFPYLHERAMIGLMATEVLPALR